MTREELMAGLATLDAPDQGMRYHSGGIVHDAPRYDSRTGEQLPPRVEAATLTVYGDRARFLYRLIDEARTTLASMKAENPGSDAASQRDGWFPVGPKPSGTPLDGLPSVRLYEGMTMQDIRLHMGEGKLSAEDVLKAANIIIGKRLASMKGA